jgi:signal transduction histidine kinase
VLVAIVGLTVAILVLSGVATLVGALVGLLILIPSLWLAEQMGRLERHRIEALLDVRIDPPTAVTDGPSWRRLVLDRQRWRCAAYFALQSMWGLTVGVVVTVVLASLVLYLVVPLVPGLVPGDGLRLAWFWTVAPGAGVWLVWGVAVVLGIAAPLVAPLLTSLDVHLARWLLGDDPQRRIAELSAKVDTLVESREATVDSVEAERRRIERDLHDGPQQRLVAIAMDLGMAREALAKDPETARALLDQAHSASKEAIVEIRHVARGIAPPILTDRGLDAAVSALAARAPVPVRVEVADVGRLDPTIEAIAYFCVSEALTNVAKHSGATSALVSVRRDDAGLEATISDDGVGGADPMEGTGLTGLRQRVTAVGGSLIVESPIGGPTVIRAVLPDRRGRVT